MCFQKLYIQCRLDFAIACLLINIAVVNNVILWDDMTLYSLSPLFRKVLGFCVEFTWAHTTCGTSQLLDRVRKSCQLLHSCLQLDRTLVIINHCTYNFYFCLPLYVCMLILVLFALLVFGTFKFGRQVAFYTGPAGVYGSTTVLLKQFFFKYVYQSFFFNSV